jgi:hypothetical protein
MVADQYHHEHDSQCSDGQAKPMTITAALVEPTKCSRVARASASGFCLRWALLRFGRYPGGAGTSSHRWGLHAKILRS